MADRVYSSREVANYILEKSREFERSVDPLQLMKLVYLSHGWTLGLLGRPLLEDDVEAWQYGPVIRKLYAHIAGSREPIVQNIPSAGIADLDDDARDIVDQVIQKYGSLSGVRLSALTHQSGTPWDKTWRAYGKNAVIPQDMIEDHFRDLKAART